MHKTYRPTALRALTTRKALKGGLKTQFNTEEAYDKYLTIQVVRRLGS